MSQSRSTSEDDFLPRAASHEAHTATQSRNSARIAGLRTKAAKPHSNLAMSNLRTTHAQPLLKDTISLMVLTNHSLPHDLARLPRLAFALSPPVSLPLAVSGVGVGGLRALGCPPHKLGGQSPCKLGGLHLASWRGPCLAAWGGCTGSGHCIFRHILRGCGID